MQRPVQIAGRPSRKTDRIAMTIDKFERLLNLITALLETTRPLTAMELQSRVPGYPDNKDSFRRAFERDKDELREMGVPLLLESVPGVDPPIDGYRIDRSRYYLRDPGLETDELAALNLAASAVRVGDVDQSTALWKLGGVDGASSADPTLDVAMDALPTDPQLASLYQACSERRTCTFLYNDKVRVIEPQGVSYQRGHWYLTGWDSATASERTFRVDRFSGDVTMGKPRSFDRRERASTPVMEPWQLGEGEELVARMLVDADHVAWAARQLGDSIPVEYLADGSAIFDIAVVNWPAFRSFVLTFLDHAELLGPETMRAQMISWLQMVAS